MKEFQVRKDDLHTTRIVEVSEDAPIAPGEILVEIERFSFTANNITYGVAGHTIGYWKFFPPHQGEADGWGLIPVWGFAKVIESACDDIPVGERLYGYYPPAQTLKLSPTKISPTQFIDGAAHRAELPVGYNVYRRVEAEADYRREMDNERALLYPLHVTSFCLWDYLKDHEWFGAQQILIISASSKTSIGLGYALSKDGEAPKSIGLTSARNADFVRGLGYYGGVMTYDAIAEIDASVPTVIVDMSGNGPLLGQLHRMLGDQMLFCSNVGMTHWEEGFKNPDIITDRSEFFFAPGHIQKRMKEWGPEAFAAKSNGFLKDSAAASSAWMTVRECAGLEALAEVYDDINKGRMPPAEGVVVTPGS